MHLVRLLRRRPRLGDVFAESAQGPRRRFHRHNFQAADIATGLINGQAYQVVNLGYGGVRISIADEALFLKEIKGGHTLDFGLVIMGQQYDLRARLISCEHGSASFTFENLTHVDEAFLANFLYFMDAGISLKAISKNSVSSFYRGPGWLSYGGLQGAMEVHLRMNDEGDVSEAHVFYLFAFRQDYALFSSKGVAVASKPLRQLQGRDKREILIHTISILVGLRQVGRTTKLDPIVHAALQKLQRPPRAA